MTTIINNDALTALKTLDTDSIDAVITDPPYGYSFMNKDWDKAVIGVEVWKEVLRVLKPGAFAAIMSSPRQDVLSRMIVNLQDAGFRTDFTSIYYTYANGFPKAANTTKILQKRGIEKPELEGSFLGFQPKPAVEVILMVMKPLSEKTYVDQALNNGKGITWLDNVRIPFQDDKDKYKEGIRVAGSELGQSSGWNDHENKDTVRIANTKGRFPANLLVSDSVFNEYSRYFDLDKWFETTFPFIITPKPSPKEKGKANKHPTVKSVKLMSYLISLLSREQDTILDPFCGSGTTCIAAKMLNRKYIGIELNPEYVDIANKRLMSVL